LQEAFEVLARMRERGVKPDEVLYNSLLDGCSKNNQMAKAFEIYQMMLEEGTVKPTTVTFNSLIDCCVRCNVQSRAWQLYEEMQAQGVKADNYTYSSLFKSIRHESQKQELNRAFAIYNSFASSANSITPDEILFNVLLDACINCKQLDRAVELLCTLKGKESTEVPQITEAEDEIILQIPTSHSQKQHSLIRPDEISFNTIIKGCAQEKKLGLAFDMLSLMKQQGLKPNDVTYNSMIDACVRCNKMHSAWSLLSEMQHNQVTPDNFTYSTLIKGIRAENHS
jgi:pentatricopeptide repeat protein